MLFGNIHNAIFWYFRLKPQVWKMLNSWSVVTVLTQASKQNGVHRDRVSMLWCQPCFQHVTTSNLARVIMVGVFMNYWIPRVKFHSRYIRSRGIICKTHRAWSELSDCDTRQKLWQFWHLHVFGLLVDISRADTGLGGKITHEWYV